MIILSSTLYKNFDTLIDSYIDSSIGITDNFISQELALDLTAHLKNLYASGYFHAAGTGNTVVGHDKLFRSDNIYWLDRKHDNKTENAFFDVIDRFVAHLNASCFTGITGYEFHFAVYDAGSFYKKHIDQFKQNNSRKFSLIIYLNENWQEGDGGELCIYLADSVLKISPLNGKSVFFKSSDIEHEVLLANKTRMSITGWLKVEMDKTSF